MIKDWNYIKSTFEGKPYVTKKELEKVDKGIKRRLRQKKLERICNEKEPSI